MKLFSFSKVTNISLVMPLRTYRRSSDDLSVLAEEKLLAVDSVISVHYVEASIRWFRLFHRDIPSQVVVLFASGKGLCE